VAGRRRTPQPRRLADHHRQPQGHRPDPAREQARRQAEGGRVSGVLTVLFLVFNEGYLATGPDTDPVRHDLTAEAIRLTRLLRALMPDDGEVAGLLALMLLNEARRIARVSASGELVTLDEQDRGSWDAALIAEGHRLVRERLARICRRQSDR
jgi:predicted RNA polymerase sigma factor